MRPADNIHKLIKNTKIKTNPEVNKAVLDGLLDRMDRAEGVHINAPQQNIWRIIMQSKMTKLAAAAAVIIVAVLIGINQFGGSIDITSVALAETLETMKKVPWMHVIGEFDTPKRKGTSEEWINFERGIFAGKGTHCATIYTNYLEGKQYSYSPGDPYSNKIQITPLAENSFYKRQFNFADSPIDLITQVLEDAKKQKYDISSEDSVLDNIDVEVIRITYDYGQTTFYRDIERNLVIRWDYVSTIRTPKTSGKVQRKKTGKEIAETNSTVEIHKRKYYFDYPDDGPEDIYALGAPRDAEIDNYCPTGDVADIFTEVRRRIDKAYDGYGAIILV